MEFVEDCEECGRLSAAYEAATMEWFRVQGQLRVAEYSRDEASMDRIVTELSVIAKHRQELRDASEKHSQARHPRVASANS